MSGSIFSVNPIAILLLLLSLLWWRILIECVLPVNTRKIPTKRINATEKKGKCTTTITTIYLASI